MHPEHHHRVGHHVADRVPGIARYREELLRFTGIPKGGRKLRDPAPHESPDPKPADLSVVSAGASLVQINRPTFEHGESSLTRTNQAKTANRQTAGAVADESMAPGARRGARSRPGALPWILPRGRPQGPSKAPISHGFGQNYAAVSDRAQL